MAQYLNLSKNISWQELLPKIGPDFCALLLRDDTNFTFAWGSEQIYKEQVFTRKSFSDFISDTSSSYVFGYFSYDLKNTFEPKLKSENRNDISLPEIFLFVPKHIVFKSGKNTIYYGNLTEREILNLLNKETIVESHSDKTTLYPTISRSQYLQNFSEIKNELLRGNIYEINYCQTFTGTFNRLNSSKTFSRLVELTSAPFSSYLSFGNNQVLCASPERYLNKKANTLISQPIKGTAKRSNIKSEDLTISNELKNNSKELSENYMIVDLVRNDLSKIALKNSVTVTELAKLHSFKNVHQLISTIKSEIKEKVELFDVINCTFPMGSMTGAPKFKAMQLAETFEDFKRGLYSGSIGYIDPNGNFDFNVVIRSLIIDSSAKKVSASVGGAITIESEPENEYEECLIKLKALQEALC